MTTVWGNHRVACVCSLWLRMWRALIRRCDRPPLPWEPCACVDGIRYVAQISDICFGSCSFTLTWHTSKEVCQVVVDLLELPSLGIALQSVWKEAAESGVKPGMAEYRNHAWEDRQHTRTVDRGDEGRLAAVYVVESRDPSAGKYRSDVLVPLETMAADVRLKPMVTPMLERASSRSRTCATTGRSLRTGHRIPSNKVTSLYLIGASHPLKAGMPFYGFQTLGLHGLCGSQSPSGVTSTFWSVVGEATSRVALYSPFATDRLQYSCAARCWTGCCSFNRKARTMQWTHQPLPCWSS